MDLQSALLKEHSKNNALRIAQYIGQHQEQFDALMHLFLNGNYRTSQRAAMVVGICAEAYPGLIKPHMKPMVENLRNPVNDAVKRNTVRTLQFLNIPESLLGETADICFGLLSNPKEAIAIKVFSMTVLLHIVQKVPELKNELQIIIEDQLPFGSTGFKSRGLKVLKALKKI